MYRKNQLNKYIFIKIEDLLRQVVLTGVIVSIVRFVFVWFVFVDLKVLFLSFTVFPFWTISTFSNAGRWPLCVFPRNKVKTLKYIEFLQYLSTEIKNIKKCLALTSGFNELISSVSDYPYIVLSLSGPSPEYLLFEPFYFMTC